MHPYIMVTLGTPDRGTYFQVYQIIGLLQAPNCTFMYLVDPERASWVRKTYIKKTYYNRVSYLIRIPCR